MMSVFEKRELLNSLVANGLTNTMPSINKGHLRFLIAGASNDETRDALNRYVLFGGEGRAYSSNGATLTSIKIPILGCDVVLDIEQLKAQLKGVRSKDVNVDLGECFSEFGAKQYPKRGVIERQIPAVPEYIWEFKNENVASMVSRQLTELEPMDWLYFATGLNESGTYSLWTTHSIDGRPLDPVEFSTAWGTDEIPRMRYILTLSAKLVQRLKDFDFDRIEMNGINPVVNFCNTQTGVTLGIMPAQVRDDLANTVNRKFTDSGWSLSRMPKSEPKSYRKLLDEAIDDLEYWESQAEGYPNRERKIASCNASIAEYKKELGIK